MISAEQLVAIDFEPLRWVVRDYVVEGATILAGPPKAGKSWLTLAWCVAVANGGDALGAIECEAGDVLYLALEDNLRRVKWRLEKLLEGGPAPARLDFDCEWPRLNAGGLDKIEEWLAEHPEARLVAIDTLAKVRQPTTGRDKLYDSDYAAVEGLVGLAGKYRVAVLILHHLRKSRDAADDPIDWVSGSTGLTGAVDTVLVLKNEIGNADAVIHVVGRDVERKESALRFDAQRGSWTLLGDAAEHRRSEARNQIIGAISGAGQLKPKEIAEMTGKTPSTVRSLLGKLLEDGTLMRAGDGTYNLPPSLY